MENILNSTYLIFCNNSGVYSYTLLKNYKKCENYSEFFRFSINLSFKELMFREFGILEESHKKPPLF